MNQRNLKYLYFLIVFFLYQNILAQDVPATDTLIKVEKIVPVELIKISEESILDLQKIRTEILPVIQDEVMVSIQPELDSIVSDARSLKAISDELLEEQNPYEYFASFSHRWERIEQRLDGPNDKVDKYATSLEENKDLLGKMMEKWNLTTEMTLDENTSEEVNERVKSTQLKIDSVNQLLSDSLNNALSLQGRFTNIKLQISEYLTSLKKGEETRLNQLITKREDYIWKRTPKEDTTAAYFDNRKVMQYTVEDATEFINSEKDELIRLGVFFFLILLGILWMRSRVEELRSKELEDIDQSVALLKSPIALSLMFTFVASATVLPIMPSVVRLVYSFIFIIPFLFVYRKIVKSKLFWVLYYFTLLFVITRATSLILIDLDNNRWFILFESFLIMFFFVWFFWKRNSIRESVGKSHYLFSFLNFTAPVYQVFILVSLVANIIGYDNLSQVLNDGVIQSIIVGLVLIVFYLSIRMMFFLFLKTNLASKSRMVVRFEATIFTWFQRFLVIYSFYFWFRSTLRGFLSWDNFSEWIIGLWNEGYGFGELTVTLGGVITFFLIVISGWIVSKIVESLLRVEFLGRFKMPRGVPMAISSLTQYVLVVFGFILAMAYVGFDLSSLGLLAGALGVGIGFGLQNIISNFISGLILVFERPITVGDTVTVDNLMGTVTSIGIRSSVIKLYDESEVIVPNTELISNKVTNWSLSNNVRRRKIEVLTTMKVDPDNIRMLLVNAAREAEDTIDYPEPQAFFNGVEDQGFQFNLYYWLTDNLFRCDSDVHTNVVKTLRENNIEMLIPKKLEVRKPDKDG